MEKEKNIVEKTKEFLTNKRNLVTLLLFLGGCSTVVTTAVAIGTNRTPSSSSISNSSPSQGSTSNVTSNVTSSSSAASFPATVTMTFDTKGGSSVEAITITNFTSNTGPAMPTKEFNNFGGWYYDEALTRSVNFSIDFLDGFYPATGNLTVYANWNPFQARISFKYVDASNREQTSSAILIPMLTCRADYNLTVPPVPVSTTLNLFSYADWDLSVLPDCLDREEHLNINIFANKILKEYTLSLITPTFYNKAIDFAGVNGADMVFLTPDYRVISRGRNIFEAPMFVRTFNNSSVATYDVTSQLPLNGEEYVIQLFSIFERSQSGNTPTNGMLFLTNQNRLIDFGNATSHNTGNKFEDLTPRLGLLENETITFVDSGAEFFIIMTSTNRVIAYGNVPGYAKTAVGQVINTSSVFGDELITDITVGLTNVALLTEAGNVGVFGYNNSGNLGIIDVFQTALVKLTEFTNVTFIKAIENRIYIVGDKGGVMNKAFGSGEYLYIANNSVVDSFVELTYFYTANDYFQPLGANESIIEIAGFINDTVFLTSLGRTLSIGTNVHKSTGLTSNLLGILRDETEFFGIVSQDRLNDRGAGIYFMPIFGITFSIREDSRIRAKGNNSYTILTSTIKNTELTDGYHTPTYASYVLLSATLIGYDLPLTFPPVPTIEGFIATGWFTELERGSNANVFRNMFPSDMTFYAVYTEAVS